MASFQLAFSVARKVSAHQFSNPSTGAHFAMSSHQSRAQVTSPPPPYAEQDPAKPGDRRRSHSRGRKAQGEGSGGGPAIGVIYVAAVQMHCRCMKGIQDKRQGSRDENEKQ